MIIRVAPRRRWSETLPHSQSLSHSHLHYKHAALNIAHWRGHMGRASHSYMYMAVCRGNCRHATPKLPLEVNPLFTITSVDCCYLNCVGTPLSAQ